jgi:Tfp pilus assembly protein PilN
MLGSSTTTGTMPRVNLLPPEIAEKAALRRSQVAMAGVGLAAVAVVGVLYVQAGAKVDDAAADKEVAVQTATQLQSDLRKLQNVRDVYAQVDAARATLASAMSTEVLWSSYLHDMTLTIPEGVWLTKFTANVPNGVSGNGTGAPAASATGVLDQGVGKITFEGAALAHSDVAAWLESLAKQKGYFQPYFTQAAKEHLFGAPDIVKFNSTVNLTPAALANRYLKGTTR